ncbi:16S rRNA (adenine(1518)-N(6)/adenine(1519)-N(6))-dimethyltransferase RsmA [Candidatus Altiarchaeota archaeon]
MTASDEHFMVDEGLLARITGYARLSPTDIVLEAGAGTGNLTRHLALSGCRVIACEFNKRYYAKLHELGREFPNIKPVQGNVLKAQISGYDKVVSNLPYSISRQFLKMMILSGFELAVLVVQKEFAEKLVARPGSGNYRMVSALAQSAAKLEILEDVAPAAFEPQPNVMSAVVRMERARDCSRRYLDFLNTLFNQRNKKLRNILDNVPKGCHDMRPRDMGPNDFLSLFETI